ncbi:peroxisomal sarcosine oxidase [Elysia marginata]|uniref:Peroxisomal sarcosine oxidase n=1 Tax=Elysia marginata TaxID=1093978 RepID=A0AAV4GLI7_9GAST|nr:peroxisomal sarcosine oxidase [Elysia marginata]
MDYCTKYWDQLQDSSGKDIFRKVGYLAIGAVGEDFLNENIHCMTVNQAPYSLFSPEEFKRKYPMLSYDDNVGGMLDPDGGVLMADKALLAMQKSFVSHGGILRDGERVERLVPGEIIQVHSDKRSYRGKSVILCCGPWTNQALSHLGTQLPLKPIRISVCYWREQTRNSHSSSLLPTFFDHKCCDGHSIYGVPSLEYPSHVKLCLHSGPAIDAELRDVTDSAYELRLLKDYVSKHFPGLESKPSIVESCIYTMTPDTHPILDRHPVLENLIIGAGFSGHGFKLAPAVGQILGDLALGKDPTNFDITPFKLSRFGNYTKANF